MMVENRRPLDAGKASPIDTFVRLFASRSTVVCADVPSS
jgi:hypothetical protein